MLRLRLMPIWSLVSTTTVNTMRWCSPADAMSRAGVMCALIGPCRFGRPIGGGGIVGSNRHVPISSDLFQKPARHRWSFRIDGHLDKCLQQSILIRRARSVERAVEAAKRRYERRCRAADWRLHADGFEMEIDLLDRTY